jgi:hypothetical protein
MLTIQDVRQPKPKNLKSSNNLKKGVEHLQMAVSASFFPNQI